MQFTTLLSALLSALVFAATALAAPAPVADSSIEARAGAPSWEFRPSVDLSCKTGTGNILGGPQTPGSQCINIIERMGDKVISGASTQGCKIYVFLNYNTNCSGNPEPAALLSNTCSPYLTPISSIRVDC